MCAFFKKTEVFDISTLRKNDINILILDERWGNLKASIPISNSIIKYEQQLVELLKEQARLIEEQKNINPLKKKFMDKIMTLTTEAYEKNNIKAKIEMKECQKQIESLNKKAEQIKERIIELPEEIKMTNLKLLESVVNSVYHNINNKTKRINELDNIIEKKKNELKILIDEKNQLKEEYELLYTYFHDLLGPEELEKLDIKKIKKIEKKETEDEGCNTQANEND